MILSEKDMLRMLRDSKNVVLIEPLYTRSWMPQGLAKIASYVKKHDGRVAFHRNTPVLPDVDLIVVTSLFTYDYLQVFNTLMSLRMIYPKTQIILGGVLATLGASKFEKYFPEVLIFKGTSRVLDTFIPDYEIDWELDEKYVNSSWVFTQRGCPNHCAYCVVPRLEPELWINPSWKRHIVDYKSDVILCDNNISAASIDHQIEVFEYLISQGKRVDVNAGIDCKHVTPKLAEVLGRVTFWGAGLKLAFDRIEEEGVFQEAVRLLVEHGVARSAIQAYVLFNFNDTPSEACYRAQECRRLHITPYPQQFTPLNSYDRVKTFIGKHWTHNLARAFRYYWLLRGHYNHMSFDEFLRGNHSKIKSQGKVHITNYDLEIWEKSEKEWRL